MTLLNTSIIKTIKHTVSTMLLCVLISSFIGLTQVAEARTAAMPWRQQHQMGDFSGLIYGSSSPRDVELILGEPPDEVVKSQSLYPVIWNYLYYADDGNGSATVFVFENGMLVGMFLRTAGQQLVDFTSFLTNNNDRRLFYNLNANRRGFFNPQRFFNPLYY